MNLPPKFPVGRGHQGLADDFQSRLLLALKALSISRGRLASALAVDKSVISRWLSGRQAPSGQNLANLTALIADRRPGFNLLDWDSDPDTLATKLGISLEPSSASPWGALGGWLPDAVLQEAQANTALRGEAYEGFWRTTRVSIGLPGRFIHDQVMIRREPNGFLAFRVWIEDMRFEGWTFPTQTQLFSIGADARTGMFVFLILNAVLRNRAEVLDGLTLTCQRTGGGMPVAGAVLMERCGFLTGDPDVDDATLLASVATGALAPDGSVPADIRDHLLKDHGPSAMANGGAAMLTMAFATSLSRAPLRDEITPSQPSDIA